MALERKSSDARDRNRPRKDARPASKPSDDPTPGYDAEEGPLETGFASQSVALDEILEDAEQDSESLSIDAEALGSHALRAATQQDFPTTERDLDEEELPGDSETEPGIVDLARNDIRNGSLFDQPRKDDPDQVRHPLVRSNEVDATLEHNERARRARSGKP